MSFEQAYAFVAEQEGGWANDENDYGGRTRFGISSRWHPDVDLDTLTREGARELMRERYWLRARCEYMPHGVNLIVFDQAVHDGPEDAVRTLQRVVGVKPDGAYGPVTNRAVWRTLATDDVHGRWLKRALLEARTRKLMNEAQHDPGQVANIEGWAVRLVRLAFAVA